METEAPSRLEKITAGIAGAVIAAEYFLCYNNFDGLHKSVIHNPDRFRWLPISDSNFGDTPEMFTAVLTSGIIGDRIEEYGQRKENKMLEYLGKYFPTLTSAAVGAYYTLGETVMPQLLSGTADIKDVPAVLITAIASPLLVNYARKQWKSKWKNSVLNCIREVNAKEC